MVKITVIGCSCVMTHKPVVPLAGTMLPGSTVAQADPAVDGRDDARVVDIHLRRGEIALVQLHRPFVLIDRGLLRGELLLRNRMLFEGVLIAREVDARVLEGRLVARQLTLSLHSAAW